MMRNNAYAYFLFLAKQMQEQAEGSAWYARDDYEKGYYKDAIIQQRNAAIDYALARSYFDFAERIEHDSQ